MKSSRVCILTQPLGLNYGALMQAWALQREIARQGCEAFTDSGRGTFYYSFLQGKVKQAKHWVSHYVLGNRQVNPHPLVMSRGTWERVSENCAEFVRNNIRTVDFFAGEDFPTEAMTEKFDTFVAGSDQVWRDSYSRVESYFFDFLEHSNKKRFSYAASFGLETWQFDAARSARLGDLTKRMQGVGVRESDAVKLCAENLGAKAVWTADPTLLHGRETYLELIRSGSTVCPSGNLMTYFLDPTPWKHELAEQIGKHLHLTAFSAMPNKVLGGDTRRFCEDCVYPSPLQWLRGFAEADFVLTDSFHGMVFAIINRKNFLVVGNKQRGISRFSSLLELLGLQDRMIAENQMPSEALILSDIDYAEPQRRLEEFVSSSREFLTRMLES